MSTGDESGRFLEILLVEDNPADVRLAREALKEGLARHRLHVASDGIAALEFLRDADAVRPDLILLDLNLPKKDGREVLAEVKQDPDLRRIPVVVLSSSNAAQDVSRAYDLHANCYVRKPVDLDEFIEALKSIEAFWLTTATLPRNPGAAPGAGAATPPSRESSNESRDTR